MIAKIFTLLVFAVCFYGCAASNSFSDKHSVPIKPDEVLARYLNRLQNWTSLRSDIKLKVQMGDSTFSAPGHLIYLLGERYEVGFAKPYNRFLGTFYITPEQTIYWDLNVSPLVYTKEDTVKLSELLPFRVPNWDPRDLLPFPIGGRTEGFQTDSILTMTEQRQLFGSSGDAKYQFQMDGQIILQETVVRPQRDKILKTYSKTKNKYGWPVPTRVVCSDSTGSFKITWKLSDIDLKAPHLPSVKSE